MGRVVGGANPHPLSTGVRRGPAVRVPFSYRTPDGEYSAHTGKRSWADALSRALLTGEAIIVWLVVTGDVVEDRLHRKRIRASINRSAHRRMMRAHVEYDPVLKALQVTVA